MQLSFVQMRSESFAMTNIVVTNFDETQKLPLNFWVSISDFLVVSMVHVWLNSFQGPI